MKIRKTTFTYFISTNFKLLNFVIDRKIYKINVDMFSRNRAFSVQPLNLHKYMKKVGNTFE